MKRYTRSRFMSRIATLTGLVCCLAFVSTFTSSCSKPTAGYKVAVIGFKDQYMAEERNDLIQFGKTKVEAALGANVDFIRPGSSDTAGLFKDGPDGYDLVGAMGQNSSLDRLFARPPDTTVAGVALDFEISQPVPGENQASLIRYR